MKKINKLITFSLLMMLGSKVNAATLTFKDCEYTNEYRNWLNLSEKEREVSIMPTICQNTSKDKYYFVGESVSLGSVKVTDSKFNLNDYNMVTSIKDQQDTQACWAFATNAAIESNLLMNGLGNYDLSEAHLELATQTKYNNNRNTFNRTKQTGGNYLVSSAYLMNSWGPLQEESLPFDRLLKYYNDEEHIYASEVVNRKGIFDVNSIMFLGNTGACNADTKNDIKEYLITNGAVATYLYVKPENKKDEYLYYNGEDVVNHSVTIIGWDDNVEVEKFGSSKPASKGAWIIKNSYGGDSYQYVSYEDVHVCNSVVGFFDIDKEVEDYTYNYDNLGANSTSKISSHTVYFASIFDKESIDTKEELKEVALYFSKINQNYEIYFANGQVFDISKMTKVGEGKSDFVGYKTIKLNNNVKINGKFTIIVKLSANEDIEFEVSRKYEGATNYDSLKLTEGVQFISTDGISYNDVTKYENNPFQLSIRAYTNRLNELVDNNNNNKSDSSTPSSSSKPNVDTNKDNSNNNVSSDSNTPDTTTENPKTGYSIPIIFIIISLTSYIVYNFKIKKLYK